MAALIEYVCTAQHDRHGEATVTLEQGSWAYCSWGASDGHKWTRIEPTTIDVLRLRAGNASARLVQHETPEQTRTR